MPDSTTDHGRLAPDELVRVHTLAVGADLANPHQRRLLVGNLPDAVAAHLPHHPKPAGQLLSDLQALNRLQPMPDVSSRLVVPFEVWLRTAEILSMERPEVARQFARLRQIVAERRQRTSLESNRGSETSQLTGPVSKTTVLMEVDLEGPFRRIDSKRVRAMLERETGCRVRRLNLLIEDPSLPVPHCSPEDDTFDPALDTLSRDAGEPSPTQREAVPPAPDAPPHAGVSMTIALHPDVDRLGDRCTLAPGLNEVGRNAPLFDGHEAGDGGPLASRFVSRSPLLVHVGPRQVRICPSESRQLEAVDGVMIDAPLDRPRDLLERDGALIRVGHGVLLLVSVQPQQTDDGPRSDNGGVKRDDIPLVVARAMRRVLDEQGMTNATRGLSTLIPIDEMSALLRRDWESQQVLGEWVEGRVRVAIEALRSAGRPQRRDPDLASAARPAFAAGRIDGEPSVTWPAPVVAALLDKHGGHVARMSAAMGVDPGPLAAYALHVLGVHPTSLIMPRQPPHGALPDAADHDPRWSVGVSGSSDEGDDEDAGG